MLSIARGTASYGTFNTSSRNMKISVVEGKGTKSEDEIYAWGHGDVPHQ